MKIYMMTSIGKAISSSPSNNNSDAMRILYWMRRHGEQCSDEQIKSFVVDGAAFQVAMNKLIRARAVMVIG